MPPSPQTAEFHAALRDAVRHDWRALVRWCRLYPQEAEQIYHGYDAACDQQWKAQLLLQGLAEDGLGSLAALMAMRLAVGEGILRGALADAVREGE